MHHRHLSTATGAFAAIASTVSGLIGIAAVYLAPHGWHRVTLAMHITRQPLLLRLAPMIAAVAVFAATIALLLRFYSWWRDQNSDRSGSTTQHQV